MFRFLFINLLSLKFIQMYAYFSSSKGNHINKSLKLLSDIRISRYLNKFQVLNLSENNNNDGEISYGGIQHCGIIVSDSERSKKFYVNVFGFVDESHLRPLTLLIKELFCDVVKMVTKFI